MAKLGKNFIYRCKVTFFGRAASRFAALIKGGHYDDLKTHIYGVVVMGWPDYRGSCTTLVDADWVAGNLDNDNLVLIDLRNKIDKGSYETYLDGHIPSSLHSDYLKDGWRVGRDDVVGLLPTEAQFEALARKLGYQQQSCYVDPSGGQFN